MNNPDHIFLELRNHFFAFLGVKILKFFDEDPGSGMEQFGCGIRDGKKSDPGSGINIPDPQHCFLRNNATSIEKARFCKKKILMLENCAK